jgi:hypothetical protein
MRMNASVACKRVIVSKLDTISMSVCDTGYKIRSLYKIYLQIPLQFADQSANAMT